MRTPLLLLLAVFVTAQVLVFAPQVDFLFLGAQWVDLPRYGGDVGVLKLSFYLAHQHVDVSVSFRCQGLDPEPARAAYAGPGVYEVLVKARAHGLGKTAGCAVVFKSRYVVKDGSLTDGVEKVDYFEVYVPHYPNPRVEVVGVVYLGLRGRVELRVGDVYAYNGSLEISAAGARVLGAATYAGDLRNVSLPLEVVAFDPSAALTVLVKARDALGREVAVYRTVPLRVSPRPMPNITISPRWLRAGTSATVDVSVRFPIPVNGTASVGRWSAPLVNGAAFLRAEAFGSPPSVVLPLVVTYDTGVADRFEVELPVYQVADPEVRVEAKPAVLVTNVVNRVEVAVYAPGEFTAQIAVSGATALGPQPVLIRGVDAAEAVVEVVPSGGVVSLAVDVAYRGGFDRRVINLLVVQKTPVEVRAEPLEVSAGGRERLLIYVTPLVNVSELGVELYPVSGLVFAQRSYRLGRSGGAVELEVDVPSDVLGNVALGYRVYYITASGAYGEHGGVIYLLAVQRPRVQVDFSVVPEGPRAGSPFYLVVRLYNKGGVEARDVTVEAVGDVKVVRQPPPLGSLAPQSSRDAVFTLMADAAGLKNITVKVLYSDRLGKTYQEVRRLTVVINASAPVAAAAPKKEGGESQLTLAAAFVALTAVAAALVLLGVRRGRVARHS
ncbi:MAG: hypothetical protein ABWK05_08735 [Pyrobaculum sp.]